VLKLPATAETVPWRTGLGATVTSMGDSTGGEIMTEAKPSAGVPLRTADAPDTDPRTWWTRPGLEIRHGRLFIAGRDAEALAREHGTPLYVYDVTHVIEQIRGVHDALARTGLPFKVRYALKAQREPEILRAVRALGTVGMDVCSPGEVAHALANGWRPEEISYTGTNVSERDLDAIFAAGVHINVDLLSQLRRVGRRRRAALDAAAGGATAPLGPAGGRVGIRINPRAGAAHRYVPVGQSPDDELRFGVYAGQKPTKFGIYPDQLDDAVRIAREYDLTIDTVHFHVSHQLLNEDLPAFDDAVGKAAAMIRHLQEAGCPIEEVNTGGGLGNPLGPGDEPLDLDAWAGILARHLGPLGVTIATEPGEYFTNRCGIVLTEVVTVEDRLGVPFIGITAGWNVMPIRFVWGEFFELVNCTAADAPRTQRVTISGHINEAPDLFAEDYPFPPTQEGDIVAILEAGSYCQAVANTHCMRPVAPALFFHDRL